MSKKVVLIAIAALVAAAAVVAIVLVVTKKDSNQANTATVSTAQKTEATAVNGSISSLLAKNEARVCTYSTTTDGDEAKGTAYFANGKLRMNYTSTSEGKSTSGSMIVNGDTQYIWDTNTKQGFKFAFKVSEPTTSSDTQGVDVNKSLDFSCKSWSVDESLFSPPSDVVIKDFSTILNQ